MKNYILLGMISLLMSCELSTDILSEENNKMSSRDINSRILVQEGCEANEELYKIPDIWFSEMPFFTTIRVETCISAARYQVRVLGYHYGKLETASYLKMGNNNYYEMGPNSIAQLYFTGSLPKYGNLDANKAIYIQLIKSDVDGTNKTIKTISVKTLEKICSGLISSLIVNDNYIRLGETVPFVLNSENHCYTYNPVPIWIRVKYELYGQTQYQSLTNIFIMSYYDKKDVIEGTVTMWNHPGLAYKNVTFQVVAGYLNSSESWRILQEFNKTLFP